MSTMQRESNVFGTVRLLAIVFLAYAIFIPLIGIIMSSPSVPSSEGLFLFSLVLMIMMPIDLFLVYIFYQLLGKRTTATNIPGIAAILFVLGSSPSIYGFIVAFTNSALKTTGALTGLSFGLVGMFIAWVLVNRLWESIGSESS